MKYRMRAIRIGDWTDREKSDACATFDFCKNYFII
jgi:hypothetical protein